MLIPSVIEQTPRGERFFDIFSRLLRDRIDHWLVASLPGPRGLGAEKLAAILREVGVSGDIAEYVSPASAYEVAVGRAAEGDRIVVFGSFLTVAEVMAARNAPQ